MGSYKRLYVPPPCTGCVNAKRCENADIACERFTYYAVTGKIRVKRLTEPNTQNFRDAFLGDNTKGHR